MTLKDFEKHIDKKILTRARDYFKSGAVEGLDESGGGEWVAEVSGAEMYTVTVLLRDEEIVSSSCDCPYDFGDFCKHEGAVFFALRELILSDSAPKAVKKTSRRKPKKEDLSEILLKVPKEILEKLLFEYARKDKK